MHINETIEYDIDIKVYVKDMHGRIFQRLEQQLVARVDHEL